MMDRAQVYHSFRRCIRMNNLGAASIRKKEYKTAMAMLSKGISEARQIMSAWKACDTKAALHESGPGTDLPIDIHLSFPASGGEEECEGSVAFVDPIHLSRFPMEAVSAALKTATRREEIQVLHPLVANLTMAIVFNLALAYHLTGDSSRAIRLYQHALMLAKGGRMMNSCCFMDTSTNHHHHHSRRTEDSSIPLLVVASLTNLATLFETTGDISSSNKCVDRVVSIFMVMASLSSSSASSSNSPSNLGKEDAVLRATSRIMLRGSAAAAA